MRLKEGFITHEGADEHITVPVGGLSFSGMVRSNKTAGFIVECLKEDVTEEEIIERMLAKYDASKEQITGDVEDVLDKLRGIGAIEEESSCWMEWLHRRRIWKSLHLNRNWSERGTLLIPAGGSVCFLCSDRREICLRSPRNRGDAGSMMWHFTSVQMGLMYCTASSRCCRMDMYFWETIV